MYTHTLESKLGPRFFSFESKLGPRLRQKLGPICFLLVLLNFVVFSGVSLKTQRVCRGAKIVVWQFVRVSKKGF